jgi:hypothetical protein
VHLPGHARRSLSDAADDGVGVRDDRALAARATR